MQLTKDVNELVKNFPKEEMYGLSSQVKRAVVSVAANIAEGVGRNTKKDTMQFLHISRGSLYELQTLLELAADFDFLDQQPFSTFSFKWKNV
jgi:four helix bundle protein